MSNENKTIHDFELKLICDFFSNMERQGPGSPEVTLKALSFIDGLTDKSLIADIGCGTGGQTMVLARQLQGQITGLDLFPDFIDIFNRNAKHLGLQNRVKGIVGSESSWFTDERPAEINDFWVDAYPEIDTIPNQVAKIHKAGYLPVATFILPATCWTEHYLALKIPAQKIFLEKYAGNKIAEEFSALQSIEEELYRKYKDFYGYTFFIAKKTGL